MKKKQGISLIVLVITIVVMIILAGAIIISLNNAGLIKKANEAVESSDEAAMKNLAQMGWADAYLDEGTVKDDEYYYNKVKQYLINQGINEEQLEKYVIHATTKGVTVKLLEEAWVQDGLKVKRGTEELTIGQTINYTAPGTDYNGGWKVLGADGEGNLLIMSATDVSTNFSLYTEGASLEKAQKIWLEGGVNKLNDECKQYGKGTYAIGARSITIEDIVKITGYAQETYGEGKIDAYGNIVTYIYNGTTKPNYIDSNEVEGTLTTDHNSNGFHWYDEEGTHSVTVANLINGANKGKEIATITSTYNGYRGSEGENELSTSSDAYKMLFTNNNDVVNSKYWLNSIDVLTRNDCLIYVVRDVNGGYVGSGWLWDSTGSASNPDDRGVRAVVTLQSNIPMEYLTK